MHSNRVSRLRFVRASSTDQDRGLIGWISCVYADSLVLAGIAVRRMRDDRISLSFPTRTDATGRRHSLVRPIDDDARQEIEAAVFKLLKIEEAS